MTDQHAAAIDAIVATGGYASVSEVIRSALRDFPNVPVGLIVTGMKQGFFAY